VRTTKKKKHSLTVAPEAAKMKGTALGFETVSPNDVVIRSEFMKGIACTFTMKTFSQPIILIAPDFPTLRLAFKEIHPELEPDEKKCKQVIEGVIGLFDYKDIEPKDPFQGGIDDISDSLSKYWFYLPCINRVTYGNSNSDSPYFGSNVKHVVKIAKVVVGDEAEAKSLMRKAGYPVSMIRNLNIVPFDIEDEIPF